MKTIIQLILISLFISACTPKQCAEYFGEVEKIKLDKQGQADLLKATQTRKIAVEEARAELESAKLKSQSEIERARGVAEANKIIGDSLKGNQAYLRYLWITNMNNDKEVIYIPTEAGMPILEAGNRK